MSHPIEKKGSYWFGPVCRVANDALEEEGSIHDESVARDIGFRGGLVAGTNHLELFPLLVREALGTGWFETGSLSIYFRVPTTHQEPARAVLHAAPAGRDAFQVEAWIQRPEGERIGEGTLAVGDPGLPTALGSRDLHRYESGDYEILRAVNVGDVFEGADTLVTEEDMKQRIQLQEAPLDWWHEPSPWGASVVTPALCVNRMYGPAEDYARNRLGISAVPMFGAIEIRNTSGPVLVGRTYRTGGNVVAKGCSPRTEYFWYEAFMAEPGGRKAAAMLMQLRFMRTVGP
jgi:hypothetical protein